MAINKCDIDGIKHRTENCQASNKDCADLLDYIDNNISSSDFMEKVIVGVECAIEGAVDTRRVVRAVEAAIMALKR